MSEGFHLRRSTPELQGVQSKAILDFIEEVEKIRTDDMGQDFHSFMLLRHGFVIAEGWWNPYQSNMPHVLFSLSKSFTSTAIGFAVEEGLLSVEDLVVTYFKNECPNPSENMAKMKVKHLLSMNTGHVVDTTGYMVEREDGNWVQGFLEVSVEKEPGTHFLYNTGATYMLSVILQKITGQKLIDYLTPRLFEPLNITDATWEICPRGYNTGGFGLRLSTEDIAKFGQLYLEQGKLEGKRILSPEWIREATYAHSDNSAGGPGDWGQGYGYQFWRCRHNAYRGDGAFGQYCVILPELDVVLAITGGMKDLQKPLTIVWDKLLSGITDQEQQESDDYVKLKNKLSSLHLLLPEGKMNSPLEESLEGKHYQLEENPFHMDEISFGFHSHEIRMTIKVEKQVIEYKVGIGQWQEGSFLFDGRPERIVFTGIWENDSTLLIQGRLLEMPFAINLLIRILDDSLVLEQKLNVGFDNPQPILIKGLLV
jgi:CubicO group peptidase (beta-lactamase class C family)